MTTMKWDKGHKIKLGKVKSTGKLQEQNPGIDGARHLGLSSNGRVSCLFCLLMLLPLYPSFLFPEALPSSLYTHQSRLLPWRDQKWQLLCVSSMTKYLLPLNGQVLILIKNLVSSLWISDPIQSNLLKQTGQDFHPQNALYGAPKRIHS